MTVYETHETTTPELQVLYGVAELLAGNPEARVPLEWPGPSGTFTGSGVPITIEEYAAGGDVVTLSEYAVSDDPSLSDSVMGVQAMVRCASRARTKAIAADVFDLLQGRRGGTLGGIRLVYAKRASGTSVGKDSEGRLGRADNYYLTVHRPSPNRT